MIYCPHLSDFIVTQHQKTSGLIRCASFAKSNGTDRSSFGVAGFLMKENAMESFLLSNHGEKILVDAADVGGLSKFSWRIKTSKRSRYARTGKECTLMHRLILNPPDNMEVDHINGNGLDNRRCNLRICTRKENVRNQRKQFGCRSKHKGVTFNDKWSKSRPWSSRIFVDGKYICIGTFSTEDDAGIAYNQAAKKHYGEFANLNQIAEKK